MYSSFQTSASDIKRELFRIDQLFYFNMSKDFYVSLLSSSSCDLYIDNKPGRFTNKLKNEIYLDDAAEWEVALTDIRLPLNIINLPNEIVHILDLKGNFTTPVVISDQANGVEMNMQFTEYWNHFISKNPDTVTLEEVIQVRNCWDYNSSTSTWSLYWYGAGYCPNVETIVQFIDAAVRALVLLPKWKFMGIDYTNSKVWYCPCKHIQSIRLYNTQIAKMLGITTPASPPYLDLEGMTPRITRHFFYNATNKRTGSFGIDLTNGNSPLFVYSDCVDTCNIGDGTGQLLRQVEYNASRNSSMNTFTNPYYKPVLRKCIDKIEIDIRDVLGHSVRFQRGITTCTLHFRRR